VVIKKDTVFGTDHVRATSVVPSTTWADRVNLVGEFNKLNCTSTTMLQTPTDANWQAVVDLKAGQWYRFRYLGDGKEWLTDWHADGSLCDGAPHGFYDSVVDLA
jgi:1,4-alpha-glucan branching enzyme